MSALLSIHRFPNRFYYLLAFVLVGFFVIENINGRFWMNDFRVYWGATNSLISGTQIYDVVYGLDSGTYKYSPMMLFLFIPLAVLPYKIAAAVYYFVICAAIIYGIHMINQLIKKYIITDSKAHAYLPLFWVVLLVIVHLQRELHLGNINMVLLLLFVAALQLQLKGKHIAAGLLIGFGIMAKPHFAVILPLLFLRGKYKTLASAAVGVGLGLLLPVIFSGWTENMVLHNSWFDAMAGHNASLFYTGGDHYNPINTVYTLIYWLGLKWMIPDPSGNVAYAILGIIALGIGALVWYNIRTGKKETANRDLIFEYLLILAIIPSITLTDTEHFLLSIPLLLYLLHYLITINNNKLLLAFSIAVLFMYGGNWNDVLGPASEWMNTHGVLGVGNVLLICLCTTLYLNQRKQLHLLPTSEKED
jgi:hypothetical protein